MITKHAIKNLQDSELIRIFLDYVQTYHLQYEKIHKEISYKCHEATWILATAKATGYGRTESQAYKHALRNLLQILIEDEEYRDFFSQATSKQEISTGATYEPKQKNRNQKCKSSSVYHLNPNSLAQENQKSTHVSHKHKNQKSEPSEEIYYSKCMMTEKEKQNSSKYINPKMLTEGSKNQYCMPPQVLNCRPREQSNSLSKSTANNLQNSNSGSKTNLGLRAQKKVYTEESANCNISHKRIYHSKINLNVTSNSTISCQNPQSVEQQLAKAKEKMLMLQEELAAIINQNNILKEKIGIDDQDRHSLNPKNIPSQTTQKSVTGATSTKCVPTSTKCVSSSINTINCENTDISRINRHSNHKSASKVMVPKLKLDILPNYHKKSEKSLNDSLLAIYNQKHGSNQRVL